MKDTKSLALGHLVSEFLKKNFTPWILHTFSENHNQKLFEELQALFSKTEILELKEEINKAIITFFNKLGAIKITVVPFISIRIETSIRESTIATYKLLLEYQDDFEIVEGSNLLIIKEDITQTILNTVKSDYDIFREDIRATLGLVIDLGTSYAILFGKSRITVRTKLKEAIREQRYLGLPPEELDAIMKRHFKDSDREIPLLMQDFLLENFDCKKMTNAEFESNHIKLLQKGLNQILKHHSNQDKEVIKALTNYILRLQFDNFHRMIAEQLLKAMVKDYKAEQFLNYYTQGVIAIQGDKYQIPMLEDINGTIWSLVNIKNVTLQYQRFIESLEKKGNLIDQMGEVLDNIDAEILKAHNDVKKVEFAESDNSNKLQDIGKLIQAIRHTFQSKGKSIKKDERASLEKELEILEKKERDFILSQRQYEQALGIAQKTYSDLEYKKNTTHERHDSEIDNLENMQESNNEVLQKYELVLTAIVKALTGKKIKL